MDAANRDPTAPDAARSAAQSGRATPMMEQYLELKAANPDCLLFYRMGDFYELFFSDAETASRALGIALTKRGKHLGRDIPMCGVPVERAEEYLHRLIALGHRVAVCEQLEDPADARKRGAKSLVRRDVVRIVTPGTLTEEALLNARRHNYLVAIARARPSSSAGSAFALAALDVSSGEFRVLECDEALLASEVARLEPAEILVSDTLYGDAELAPYLRTLPVTPLARDAFDGATAERRLSSYFGVATTDAFGTFSRLQLTAAAACVTYLERTQLGTKPPVSPPSREASSDVLQIDAATRANLELVRTLGGEHNGSLLAAIDRTLTSAGARLLAQRLKGPLMDPRRISRRLDALDWFKHNPEALSQTRAALAAAPDLARALTRIVVRRGGPRDLAAIRDALATAAALAGRFQKFAGIPAEISDALEVMREPAGWPRELESALADALPAHKRDGGFVRPGYDSSLDEARALRDESRRVVAALQARYAEETGIRTLKVRHNNVLGYFVEVTAQHAEKLTTSPARAVFTHRQTLAGQVRFATAELAELESKIASAAERALALELAIFDRFAAHVAGAAAAIREAAGALALLDVTAALTSLALQQGYVRPEIDESVAFRIEAGRHPVVEQALDSGPFVANDCDLSPSGEAAAGRIWLLTGPNMAGKSTFLRQNALIAVLAQMGSFVPAKYARIGVVDRLFSRVGAADDLARGRSTFMVEMVETAAILNQAGPRSLVILDEIGRGTATFDGLSIAWATIEHLHETNRCRALFATHFHEMTALAQKLPRLHNATVRVKEWQGEVVFLHEVAPGAADRSYGVQVAKLAGLPASVVERAKLVLAQLEADDRISPARRLLDDLPLFSSARRPAAPLLGGNAEAVLSALLALNPDDMSPRAALEALYALKARAAAGD